jgi:hypothetical protein
MDNALREDHAVNLADRTKASARVLPMMPRPK